MRHLFLIIVMLIAMAAPALSRGGMHSYAPHSYSLSAPANPSVPPSLTPDTRVIGSAPLPAERQPTRASIGSAPALQLQPDPEDAKVDRTIEGICRGC